MSTHRYYFHTSSTAPNDPGRDGSYWPAGHTGVMALLSPTRLPQPTPLEGSELASLGALAVGSLFEAFRFAAPTPATGTLSGRVRGVVVALQQAGGGAKTAKVHVRVRVLRSDNTVRGTLMAGTFGSPFSVVGGFQSASGTTRYWDAPITPVAGVVATDRVVVELGHAVVSGTSNNNAKIARYNNQTTDLPLTEGIVWSSAPANTWVELELLSPPEVPTSVAAEAGTDSVTLTWAPPASGPAPTRYDVRIGGGDPVDAGAALSWTFGGLTPLTTYAVEVRSVAPGGVSAWVAAEATTLAGAAYRAVVRLGSRTWDVLAGDPAQLGPVLPVSFGWQVPEDSLGFPAQPDPDVANLELVTADHADMAGVDIGTTMRVSLYTTSAPTARPLATFRGRVADLEAAPHPHGLAWRVLGVGYEADLGGRQVGTAAWPQESGDARAARIMAEAGFPGWTAPPIGTTLESREPAATTARAMVEALTDQAVTAQDNAYGPSRRVLVHPVTDANGNPDPARPFAGAAVLRRVDALDAIAAGLVNRSTSWRRTKLLDATWVAIDHPGGPTTYGDTRGPAYPPVSVSVTDPRELADLILDTTPGYRWLTGQPLRVELWADDGPALAVVSQWFHRDPASPAFPWSGRAVVVEGIDKSPDGSSRYAGMLTAATMRLESSPVGGRLVVEFRLRPDIPADSTVTMRWMDEPAGATWADELAADPTGTWYDYYTRPRP